MSHEEPSVVGLHIAVAPSDILIWRGCGAPPVGCILSMRRFWLFQNLSRARVGWLMILPCGADAEDTP